MIFVVFYLFLALDWSFKDNSYNSSIIKLYDSNFFLIGEQMGAILCIRSAWPQDSPRDTVAMHGNLFGESSQGDCADLFCLACENRGQILKLQTNNDENTIFEDGKASLGSDGSVSENMLQEKQKSQSRSNNINSTMKLPSLDFHSTSWLAASCPDSSPITIRPSKKQIICLKSMKPLPQTCLVQNLQ